MSRSIFISYRRSDSEGEAGRLSDVLSQRFTEQAVFMDVDAIQPGRDFRKAIEESIQGCAVLLTVIGPEWLEAKNTPGLRRLDETNDFVRLEIAAALRRDIPVIPVLVRGARIPRAEELPEDVAELAYRNGVELTHARWRSDLQVLIRALEPYMDQPCAPSPAQPPAGQAAQPGGSPAARPMGQAPSLAGLGRPAGGGQAAPAREERRAPTTRSGLGWAQPGAGQAAAPAGQSLAPAGRPAVNAGQSAAPGAGLQASPQPGPGGAAAGVKPVGTPYGVPAHVVVQPLAPAAREAHAPAPNPAGAAGSVAASGTAQPPAGLDPAAIEKVSRQLAQYIGPIAEFVVRRMAKQCGSVAELRIRVAEEIESPGDRRQFLAQVQR